ncbi:MAG: PLP-dependent aminotransferase family protein [Anaerolineaceae bacterium]|nr:MAG: PLP-dependent aminotransferase family protein [Anaerolineaceae bacterium]
MIIIDNELGTPIYMQIYEQIKNQIISKEIPGGSKLPSIRTLSTILNVSRNTIGTAYQQLTSEGYIESKPGSGFIALELEYMDFFKPERKYTGQYNTFKKDFKEEADLKYKYNFRDRSLSAHDFPLHIWRKLSNQFLSSARSEDFAKYNAKTGEANLQIELMKYLYKSRGVSCNPEQIIISPGMEYSLSILCQLLREDHNQIAFEEPGYMVARDIFTNNGLKVLPISLLNDGINIEELNSSSAKMVYVTPSHQFPMGYVMPIKKRLKLLEWAIKNNGIILEDDYDSEFRYNSRPIPSLQSIDSKGCVIYLGTFSKTMSPSLRMSYMVLPQALLERYEKLFYWYRITVPYIQQNILRNFMELGYWDRHLRKIHQSSMKKHYLLINTINEIMEDKVIIHGENGGLHILLEFNNGLKEKEIIERAKNNSILVSAASTFWMNKNNYSDNMIMLGFGGMPEHEIVEGIKALKSSLIHLI